MRSSLAACLPNNNGGHLDSVSADLFYSILTILTSCSSDYATPRSLKLARVCIVR